MKKQKPGGSPKALPYNKSDLRDLETERLNGFINQKQRDLKFAYEAIEKLKNTLISLVEKEKQTEREKLSGLIDKYITAREETDELNSAIQGIIQSNSHRSNEQAKLEKQLMEERASSKILHQYITAYQQRESQLQQALESLSSKKDQERPQHSNSPNISSLQPGHHYDDSYRQQNPYFQFENLSLKNELEREKEKTRTYHEEILEYKRRIELLHEELLDSQLSLKLSQEALNNAKIREEKNSKMHDERLEEERQLFRNMEFRVNELQLLMKGQVSSIKDNHRFDEIAHEEKLIQYEKQIKEKDAAIRDITRQKDNLEIELERLKERNSSILSYTQNSAVDTVQNQNVELITKCTRLENQVVLLTNKLESEMGQRLEAENVITVLEEKLAIKEKQIDRLRCEAEELGKLLEQEIKWRTNSMSAQHRRMRDDQVILHSINNRSDPNSRPKQEDSGAGENAKAKDMILKNNRDILIANSQMMNQLDSMLKSGTKKGSLMEDMADYISDSHAAMEEDSQEVNNHQGPVSNQDINLGKTENSDATTEANNQIERENSDS